MGVYCRQGFSALCIGVCFLCATVASESRAETRLRIGVITPLTSGIVACGEAASRSILLADEMYDKAGLVEFDIEDDGFAPKNSVSLARKFIDQKADGIIIVGTPNALAVAPLTEKAGMPLAAVSILDRLVEGRQYTVRHFVAWQEENKRVLAEVKRRGYQRVAIVTTTNDATLALRDGFVAGGVSGVVLNEEFPRDEMDFKTIATRIKAARPDAVYNLLFAPQGSAFMVALREAGSTAQVFAAHNVEDSAEVRAARGTFEGIWYVTGDDRAGAFFNSAYQRKYGSYPVMCGASAFDYAKMLIEAAQKDIPVLKQLKGLKDFDGAYGHYGAAPGNTFALRAVVRTIKDGSFIDAE